jgi:hypothetical protein
MMTVEQQVELDDLRAEVMKAARDAMQRGALDSSGLSIVFGVGICVGGLIWCENEPSREPMIDQLRKYKTELEALRGTNV